jgi:7-keto-8-aminopelargonate synthetase-like enzyme
MLLVDEAHATGIFGPNGRGATESMFSRDAPAERVEPANQHCTLQHHIHIRVATLSKALGSAGGFVCGRQSLIDWLANRARSYVFSTAQPPANCAAALAALEIVRTEPHRRTQLLARAADLRLRLCEQGWHTAQSQSQIIPLITRDPNRTMRLAAKLRDAGFFVPGIRPPSVPEGESLLRLSLCYHHTPEMIEGLVGELARFH